MTDLVFIYFPFFLVHLMLLINFSVYVSKQVQIRHWLTLMLLDAIRSFFGKLQFKAAALYLFEA